MRFPLSCAIFKLFHALQKISYHFFAVPSRQLRNDDLKTQWRDLQFVLQYCWSIFDRKNIERLKDYSDKSLEGFSSFF